MSNLQGSEGIKYKVKEKFHGLIISRTFPGVGTITFNSANIHADDLWKYLDTFGDLIEEIPGEQKPEPVIENNTKTVNNQHEPIKQPEKKKRGRKPKNRN